MSHFVSRYKQEWDELEALLRRARRWWRPLSADERQRLDELYRRTTIQLARVTTGTSDHNLINYLNKLTAAAHSVIYLPPRQSAVQKIGQFFWEGFARAIARHWRAHLLSAVLVMGGALVGYWFAASDPILAHALWPSMDPRQPGSTPPQLLNHLRYGRDEGGGQKFLFASFLFQHNLKVGILAMVTGVLAAVPTVLLMIFNGMLLGVFAAIHHEAGIRAEMWAWILPHGITELGAIILCGGVGFILGKAVVQPGEFTRNESLMRAGREAVLTCVGVGAMLLAAALIESYIRQSNWTTAARLTFAGATAVFWLAYIAHGLYRERCAEPNAQSIIPMATSVHDHLAAELARRDSRGASLAAKRNKRVVTAGSVAVVQRID
jgi:uncharacterized membrane protein SpoIIM required for sporulation